MNVGIHEVWHCRQDLSNYFSFSAYKQIFMDVITHKTLQCMQYMDNILCLLHLMKVVFYCKRSPKSALFPKHGIRFPRSASSTNVGDNNFINFSTVCRPGQGCFMFSVQCSFDSSSTDCSMLQLQTRCRLTTANLHYSRIHLVYPHLGVHFCETAL